MCEANHRTVFERDRTLVALYQITLAIHITNLGIGQKVLGGGGGGPEQKGFGSSVFEPLVRGFFNRKWNTIDTTDNRGNSFQLQRTNTFRAVAERVHLAGVQ